MPPSERLRLARATYRDAVSRARLANTPQAWRRLARAGENLREVEVHRRSYARPPCHGGVALRVEGFPAPRTTLRVVLSEDFRAKTAPHDRPALALLHQVKTPP
ncbi:MAG TPA: hypothetical protein VF341_13385 [Anaeromyxobacteraceae bacterium]